MLKFLENRDEVVELIHDMATRPEFSAFKIGVAGSYVTGENKKNSPIDIVLKLKDGEDEDKIGSFLVNFYIHQYMEAAYSNKIHIIWLDLLEADETDLLDYQKEQGIEANPESAYTNIVSDIRWVDDEDDSDDLSDKVVTYDEEDE